MAQYIPKDAMLAEIENIRKHYIERDDFDNGWNFALNKILSFLDTLKVKWVDFEEELKHYCNDYYNCDYPKQIEEGSCSEVMPHIVSAAKHFFELGVNASNPLTWKDIDLILDITDQIANDDSMEEKLNNMSQEKYCTEVLKRFKAQKGEEV